MRHRYIAIICFLCLSMQVCAQRSYQHGHHAGLQQRYEDSLTVFRSRLDSLLADSTLSISQRQRLLKSKIGKSTGIEYNVLFLPTTFYKTVSRNNFELNRTPSSLDEALLNIYLQRPDLVTNTETQLEKTGGTIDAAPVVIDRAPEIVENVAPKAIEPTIEPVDMVIVKPNFWSFSGDYYLQLLQNYVSSNWYKGGESNYSMVGSLTLNANYNNKQKVKWDNKLEMKLGLQTAREDSIHSLRASENLLRITSKYGLQASKKWYYTAQLVAYTQFVRQWVSNSDVVTTDFLGPLVVNLSLGMDYTANWLHKRLTGTIHLAPIAYNFKYVNRLSLSKRYGLDEGKHTLNDFGSQLTVDLLWKMAENLSWQTRLYAYTTYERMEAEWENTLTFQFNKWISTKLFVYPRFDDGAAKVDGHSYWQLKEYLSFGFSYSF